MGEGGKKRERGAKERGGDRKGGGERGGGERGGEKRRGSAEAREAGQQQLAASATEKPKEDAFSHNATCAVVAGTHHTE